MQIRPSSNLAEQLADYLGQQIVDGTLAADEPIAESRLAAELQVSRGSVREAMLILERRHLVQLIPRRGAVVMAMRRQEMSALYELRAILAQASWGVLAQGWQESHRASLQAALDALAIQIEQPAGAALGSAVAAFFDAAAHLVNNCYLLQVLQNLGPATRRALLPLQQYPLQARRQMLQRCQAMFDRAAGGHAEAAGQLAADWWRGLATQPAAQPIQDACLHAA